MKKQLLLLASCFAALAVNAAPVGIASGAKTGTNWPFAEDIARVCSTPDSPITNVVTAGSGENIDKIYSDKSVQYGIVQEDAAVYQQGIDPDMMKRVVMVFPLFSTEVHLVTKAGAPINSLSQLQGKKVVEGPNGSATWITVQVLKAATGLKWTPVIASQKDGLNMVLNGQADAEFIVAGKPISMLQEQKVGLKLVPVEHPEIDKLPFYKRTLLSSDLYPFSKTNVTTYKANTILATYMFRNQYQKEIGDLVRCITKNIDVLQSTGHEKWRDVDPLDITRIKWPSHPAAVSAIKSVLLSSLNRQNANDHPIYPGRGRSVGASHPARDHPALLGVYSNE